MAQIFSRRSNYIPAAAGVGSILFLVAVVGFFWYYGSPKYTDVGYRPTQPVPFSHKLHAGDLGMDCRYCHSMVENSRFANVPPTRTCMNCHSLVGTDKETLAPVRESWATGQPIEWVRVHQLPDYAYFNHSAHLRAGVSCFTCHGEIPRMEKVTLAQPLSMGWCLECHRNPALNIRPTSELTNLTWTPPPTNADFVAKFMKEKNINPPLNCSGCHR